MAATAGRPLTRRRQDWPLCWSRCLASLASLSRLEADVGPLPLRPLRPWTRIRRQRPQSHRLQHRVREVPAPPSDAAFTRTLTVPLNKNSGGYASIYLVTGQVTASGAGADDIYYQRNESGQLEIAFNMTTAILTDHSSSIGKEECAQAIATSPTAEPLRRLAKGTLICATGRDNGIALLQIIRVPSKCRDVRFMSIGCRAG
jgi:hypothetical protein